MLEVYKAPKRRKGCSSCGKEKILVMSSILNGSLCDDCYDKIVRKGGDITISGDIITKEQQQKLIGYRAKYSRLVITALIDIYNRYVARMDKIIETGDKVRFKMSCIYRGKRCAIDVASCSNKQFKQLKYRVYDAETNSTKVIRTFVESSVDNKIYIVK